MKMRASSKYLRRSGLFSLLLLMLVAVFGAGGNVAAQSQNDPLDLNDNWTICHATASDSNPYVVNSPDIESIVGNSQGPNGHDTHVNDIIPPFYYWSGTETLNFPGRNWDATGEATFNNSCKPVVVPELLLAVLGVVSTTCNGTPVLTLPADGNGVTYSQDQEAAPGATVTVYATLNSATHIWGDTTGWNATGQPNVLSQTFSFGQPECYQSAVFGPVSFGDATCSTDPTLTLPPDANGVSYSQDKAAARGTSVIVSATLNSATHTWGDTTGWTATDDPNVYTKGFTFSNPDCRQPATLGVVIFAEATCESAPSLTLPVSANGVSYSQSGPAAAGATVTVSATLNSETHVWGDTTGWTVTDNPNVVTKSFTFADPDCDVTERPAARLGVVSFTDATCDVEPSLTLPPNGDGVTYTQDKDAKAGETVVVTATLNSETHQWGDTSGWSSTDDPRALTKSFTFADPNCETPQKPEEPKAETPKPKPEKAVTALPETGTGHGAKSDSGTALVITAFGAIALGGVAILTNRKRA